LPDTPPFDAQHWVNHLQLLEHPEGGWFKEVYRSDGNIPAGALPEGFNGERSFSTSIYFLLSAGIFSAFHRIRSDEVWHFYAGDGLLIHEIDTAGKYIVHQLGADVAKGEAFQLVIPAGSWFASEVKPGGNYGLVGCTVAPGFDFRDFEMASGTELAESYPKFSQQILRLCR